MKVAESLHYYYVFTKYYNSLIKWMKKERPFVVKSRWQNSIKLHKGAIYDKVRAKDSLLENGSPELKFYQDNEEDNYTNAVMGINAEFLKEFNSSITQETTQEIKLRNPYRIELLNWWWWSQILQQNKLRNI